MESNASVEKSKIFPQVLGKLLVEFSALPTTSVTSFFLFFLNP
jgi:hypothetical protein